MANELLLATENGLWIAASGGEGWHTPVQHLAGREMTSVMAREGVILAGSTTGVLRSDDRGLTWREVNEGLTVRHVRWLAFHPDISDCEFAGTEPASIFVSHDGAETWRACDEVAHLRDEHGWYLPYSPEAGCVRSFAFHGQRALAAVEVGGVLRSDDGGETWRLAGGSTGKPHIGHAPPAPLLHPDVHSVAIHPASPDLLFVATHAGLHRSRDGGAQWERLYEDCYTRALWLDPTDADHLIFGPATRQEWRGTLVESRDGGTTWREAAEGLSVPWEPGTLVERFTQVGQTLLALLSDGTLLAAPLATLVWQPLLPGVPAIQAVALFTE